MVSSTAASLRLSGSFITGQQASWGSLGLRHAGSLSSTIHRHLSCHQRQGQALCISFPGRVHVTEQVLAASLWYHASFQQPSEQLLRQLNQQLRKFVASAQQGSYRDDAVALAQDCPQGSAHLPSAGPGAALFPGEPTSSLPMSKGGVGLVHEPTQIQALQAKVISQLLEPKRLAWKVFQLYHLSQASQPLGMGQHLVQHAQHRPIAIAISAVSLRDGLQGSSSSPPSTSHCHAAIGCLKRATLLQQADLSACCQLSYSQHCLPSCCIPDSSAKAPYAFSGHH